MYTAQFGYQTTFYLIVKYLTIASVKKQQKLLENVDLLLSYNICCYHRRLPRLELLSFHIFALFEKKILKWIYLQLSIMKNY